MLGTLSKCCTVQEWKRWALTCLKRERFVTEVTLRLGHEKLVEFQQRGYRLAASEHRL